MTTVNKRPVLNPGDTQESLKRVLVGQAERASRGLSDITNQRASLPQRDSREERSDSQLIARRERTGHQSSCALVSPGPMREVHTGLGIRFHPLPHFFHGLYTRNRA